MQILDNLTPLELAQSLLAECAKASSEIKTARADLEKAERRIKFSIMLANTIIEKGCRDGIK